MRNSILPALAFGLVAYICQALAQTPDPPATKSQDQLMASLTPKVGEWPKLIVNNEPEICQGYLKAIQSSYMKKTMHVTLGGGLEAWGAKSLFDVKPYKEYPPTSALPISVTPGKIGDDFYAFIKIDLDHDGAQEGLLFYLWQFGWRGYVYEKRIISSADIPALERIIENFSSETRADNFKVIERYFNKGENIDRYGGYHLQPPEIILAANNSVYITPGFSDQDLYRITPTGPVLACSVEIFPESNLAPLFTQLMLNVQRTQGEECGWGSLRPLLRLQELNEADRLNLMFRPWALRIDPTASHNIYSFLEAWSYTDPWSRQIYKNIMTLYPQAREELKSHLTEKFGLPAEENKTEQLADYMLWQTMNNHYVYGSHGEVSSTVKARLYKGELSPSELKSAFRNEGSNPKGHEYLLAALDQPNLIKPLIKMGNNVNAVNHFGKTALMYAAQLDYRETARLLLKYGANVNAKTYEAPKQFHNAQSGDLQGYTLCTNISSTPRTALTYAAENASYGTINLLISAGADFPDNFPRKSIIDLFDRNPKLTEKEKLKLRQRINWK